MQVIYLESLDENAVPEGVAGPFEKVVIRKPMPPKVAKVHRFKQVGARNWSTIYMVKDDMSNVLYSNEILKLAVNRAKELAIRNLKEYFICVGKMLINNDPLVAVVKPGKHRPGKFKFIILNG